jgi:hypothetical protein
MNIFIALCENNSGFSIKIRTELNWVVDCAQSNILSMVAIEDDVNCNRSEYWLGSRSCWIHYIMAI